MKRTSRKQNLLPLATAALSFCAGSAGGNPIQTIEPNPSIDIRGISVNPETKFVTLRWTSHPNSTYLIEETSDLGKSWVQNLAGIEATSSETSFTILPNQDQGGSRAMFFRVLEMQGEFIEATDNDLADESSIEAKTAPVKSPTPQTKRSAQELALKNAETSSRKAEAQKQLPFTHPQPNFVVY